MIKGHVISRTARGYWSLHLSFEMAVAHHRRLAGDRRGKAELWMLVADGALYVGPRGRRRSSRHIAHIFTENAATLLGFEVPERIKTMLARPA